MVARLALALIVGVGLTAGGYTAAQRYEASVQAALTAEQMGRVHDRAVARSRDLEQVLRETAMYYGERDVNLMSFEPRLMAISDHHPTFRVVTWLPVVQRADAPRFLAEIRRAIPDFAFREVNQQTGEIQGAGEALAYVPFLLLQPEHGNEMLRGVDLGNQKPLAEAMQRSYKIDGVSASAPTDGLPQGDTSLVLLHYVQRPEGFVGGVVEVDDLLDHWLADAPEGLVARLSDEQRGSVPLVEQEGFVAEQAQRFEVVLGGQRLGLWLSTTPDHQPLRKVLATAVLFAGVGVTLVLLALSLLGGGASARESR
jgi:hypothetical protein